MTTSSKTPDNDCFTCAAAHNPPRPELVAYRGDLMLVNHYHSGPGELERTGWFIVAPVRHVCRWFELTREEQHALAEMAAAVDKALSSPARGVGWCINHHPNLSLRTGHRCQ
jgi:diadenosine tetraphosphate (Ap4A) HIT family hydrolase